MTTSTQLIKHGEVELVPTWSPHTNVLVSGVERYSVGFQKRNMDTNPATKLLTYTLLAYEICWVNGSTELVVVVNQCLEAHSRRFNSYLTLPR